jgi:ADP-glucose pyrophosphorylase
VVSVTRDGCIRQFVEKPSADQLEPDQATTLASMGIYVFDAAGQQLRDGHMVA